jgi:hypothetical protein
MRWRRWLCGLLGILKMHRPDCEHCSAYTKCWGSDMRKRLEDLR